MDRSWQGKPFSEPSYMAPAPEAEGPQLFTAWPLLGDRFPRGLAHLQGRLSVFPELDFAGVFGLQLQKTVEKRRGLDLFGPSHSESELTSCCIGLHERSGCH